jgi:hypothetical protein
MTDWVVDVGGFLLLCAGLRFGQPRLLRLCCLVGAVYVVVFSVCYYFWLLPQYNSFKTHPEVLYTGIASAFRFEGFWKLLSNMVLLEAMLPVAGILLLFFAVKWLITSSRPGSSYY